nr:unnamed protein product [Haemonchus contortus]
MTGPLRIAANSKWSPSYRVQRRHVSYPVDARSNRGSGVGFIVTSLYPSSSNQRHLVQESTLHEMSENHRLMGAFLNQDQVTVLSVRGREVIFQLMGDPDWDRG